VTDTPEQRDDKPTLKKKTASSEGADAGSASKKSLKGAHKRAVKSSRASESNKKPTPKAAKAAASKTRAKALGTATVRMVDELRAAMAPWRVSEEKIALVPTMGALHAGHIALVEKAKSLAERTVVSIFVNPAQFAPHEDLARYPRDEESDLKQLSALGVDLVWAPNVEEMYPDGFTTSVKPGTAAEGLETDFRPHFFGGVATVVAKLFNQVRADFAVFGEKDYQQLIVVKQLARDLDMGLKIIPVPTVREKDGLALSSRNAYLSDEERAVGPNLKLVLSEVAQAAADGASVPHLKADAQMRLLSLGFSKVDYVEVRDAETLAPFDATSKRAGRVLGAAWLGKTRLIDNVAVPQ
jgi:pantoate--beta-alanine ligase